MSIESTSTPAEKAQHDVTVTLTARLPSGDIVNVLSHFDNPTRAEMTADVVLMHLHSSLSKLGYYFEQRWRELGGN